MAKIPYILPHENTQEIAQTISCGIRIYLDSNTATIKL